MSIPSGVQKTLIIGKEGASTWGTAAAAGSGKKYRRVTSTFNLRKGTYQSAEIRSDQQTVDYRHGNKTVDGTLNGELSCLTFQDLFAAAFRSAWAAGSTTGAVITIAAAASAPNGTYTRSTGSFVTDGFKVGDLVLVSGFVTSGNNGQRIIVTLTATVMTVADPAATMATEAAGPSVTILVDGKKLTVPSTGHTNDSFTVEELYEMGATDVSELSVGNRVAGFGIQIQPNGMATVNFTFMGKDMTSDAIAHFTAPTAETVTAVMSGASGALYVDGSAVAIVTGITFDYAGGAEVGEVVGANVTPDVFMGRFTATGQFTAYFLDDSLWQKFKDESELRLVFRLNGGTDQVFVINLPRIKLGGIDKDDKETGGLIQTVPFTAIKYIGTGNFDGTTMVLQDTEAA